MSLFHSLPTLNPDEPYDIIFIDAQKSGYPNYLASILKKSQPGASNRLLRPGGLIIADNVLRRGLVADESDDNPNANQEKVKEHWSQYQASNDLVRLREFNDQMATDPRLEAWLMPLFDGVGMARLRD
jgi:predicted O-methyltransferase YrrM